MAKITDRMVAYLALVGFCLLSAIRDVVSEGFFKGRLYEASPIFVLFVYSVITQLLAALVLAVSTRMRGFTKAASWQTTWELGWVNFYTLAAFLFYFLAVASPLGAAMNSFVDYGTAPLFTAAIAVILAREKIERTFVVSALLSIIGIAGLALPRLQAPSISLLWLFGLLLAILSSLSSGCYRVYFKLLLADGLSRSAIIFFRLIGTTLVPGIVLLFRPELFRPNLLGAVAVVGVLGFALPLFLVLTILQRIALGSYAMLLFSVPAVTYLLSAVFGYGQFYATDLPAALLILAAVGLHEARSITRARG